MDTLMGSRLVSDEFKRILSGEDKDVTIDIKHIGALVDVVAKAERIEKVHLAFKDITEVLGEKLVDNMQSDRSVIEGADRFIRIRDDLDSLRDELFSLIIKMQINIATYFNNTEAWDPSRWLSELNTITRSHDPNLFNPVE